MYSASPVEYIACTCNDVLFYDDLYGHYGVTVLKSRVHDIVCLYDEWSSAILITTFVNFQVSVQNFVLPVYRTTSS